MEKNKRVLILIVMEDTLGELITVSTTNLS